MPGHGLSSHRPPGVFYSFPAYVADVRRIVDSEFKTMQDLFQRDVEVEVKSDWL